MPAQVVVRVQKESFDASAEAAALAGERKGIGAIVTFAGLCRDEGGTLEALEIEHFPGMAESEIHRIAREACARWPLEALLVIHRFGMIRPGEPIVLVVTASAHRGEAFAAASFLMDFLKTDAPFWKKQHRADGGEGGWVEAKAKDDAARERWET
ncbi:MAG TPA: molybdenum cofactor biosynthesis protein MoaE [Methylocella sp.]|nr:molybdenum cofactor biosynthesis protein MoaE [Methylocella sp.]